MNPSLLLRQIRDAGMLTRIESDAAIRHEFVYRKIQAGSEVVNRIFDTLIPYSPHAINTLLKTDDEKFMFVRLALCGLAQIADRAQTEYSIGHVMNSDLALRAIQLAGVRVALIKAGGKSAEPLNLKFAEGHDEYAPKTLAVPRRKTTKLKQIREFVVNALSGGMARQECIEKISSTFGVTSGSAGVYYNKFRGA